MCGERGGVREWQGGGLLRESARARAGAREKTRARARARIKAGERGIRNSGLCTEGGAAAPEGRMFELV